MNFRNIGLTCFLISLCTISSFASDTIANIEWPPKSIKYDIWVVNFGTATTLAPKKFGFAAGIGGQMVFVGDPRTTNAFFTIPHAGFRYGLADKVDIGLRLAPIPLPFSTVGPGFGINLDIKYCFTPPPGQTHRDFV